MIPPAPAPARASFVLLVALMAWGCEAGDAEPASDPNVIEVAADLPLSAGDAEVLARAARGPGGLETALAGLDGPVRVRLAPGRHVLAGAPYEDPACGNCEDPAERVPATLGLRVSGTGIEIEGSHPDSVVVHANAGYGVLFEDCEGCALRGITVTGAHRDPDGRATSGAVLARRSDVRIENCAIRDNLGDPEVVAQVVAGVAGIVGREDADLHVEGCRIERNSWDGIVLYRDARATIRNNIVDGIDQESLASSGGGAGGGRGVGIGLTWNARALVEGNLVRRYWKGIGVFVDADAELRGNVVEEILTWGIAYWAPGDGQARMTAHGNAVYRTGACGVMISGPENSVGALRETLIVETTFDPRYDSGEPYCPQHPIALARVPEGFRIEANLLHANRMQGEDAAGESLERDGFEARAAAIIKALEAGVATGRSAFVAAFAAGGSP